MSAPAPVATVVIVDRDADARRILSDCLKKLQPGIQIRECLDEASALETVSGLDPKVELVFSEIKGPGLDGMSLSRALHSLPEATRPGRIFLCSDLVDATTSADSDSWLLFLSKPFDPRSLLEILKRHLPPSAAAKPRPAVPQKGPKVDATVFNTFAQGMSTIFNRMVNADIGRDRLHLRKDEPLSGDIAATLPLKSLSFEGQMVIVMDQGCFLNLAQRLLKESFTTINAQNQDVLSEISNQVFGYAKMVLNDIGFGFEMAIPTVVLGEHAVFPPAGPGQIHVATRFMSEFGEFTLELQIRKLLS